MSINDKNSINTELTVEVVSAYVGNNPIAADQLPSLIKLVYGELNALSAEVEQQEVVNDAEPAVSIKKSLKKDRLTCLECGKTFKSIKRHLNTSHELSPDQYRSKWGLKSDYPMVAPDYADARSKLATDMGLGQKKT